MADIGDEVSVHFNNPFEINGAVKLVRMMAELNCANSGHLVLNPDHWQALQEIQPVQFAGGFNDTLVTRRPTTDA